MKKHKTMTDPTNEEKLKDLVTGITQIINRPSLTKMTVKQAYAILADFQDSFLTKEERTLPLQQKKAVWQRYITTHEFAKSDADLNQLIGILGIGGNAYATKDKPGFAPLVNLLDDAQQNGLVWAWNTMEEGSKSKNPVAQEIAAHLQQAIYDHLPAQNNLKNPDSAIQRINNTGKGNKGFSK